MKVKLSLGFSVEVDDNGRVQLPDQSFSTAELKKIAREVNKAIRASNLEQNIQEVEI